MTDDARSSTEGGPVLGAPRLATEVVGRRGIQFVIDTALHSALWYCSAVLWVVLHLPGGDGVLLPLFFVSHWAIFALVPWRFRGQTPGMTIMSISVVRRGGGRPDFGQFFVRWLVLLVEGPFALGLLGLVLISLSRDHTRLGDKAADTWVVWSPRGQPAWVEGAEPATG